MGSAEISLRENLHIEISLGSKEIERYLEEGGRRKEFEFEHSYCRDRFIEKCSRIVKTRVFTFVGELLEKLKEIFLCASNITKGICKERRVS